MPDFFDIENLFPWSYLDPIPSADTANANTESITTSALLITPGDNVRSITVVSDKDCRVNPLGGAAVNDETCVLVSANDHTTITVVPGVEVYALSLSGAASITATPMVRARLTGRALGAHLHGASKLATTAILKQVAPKVATLGGRGGIAGVAVKARLTASSRVGAVGGVRALASAPWYIGANLSGAAGLKALAGKRWNIAALMAGSSSAKAWSYRI